MRAPRVELHVTDDCPHAERAEQLLRTVLAEGLVDAGGRPVAAPRIERVVIDELDEAASFGFHGSPTIRIGGRDVAPHADGEIGLACRLYRQPDGSLDGIPSEAAVREALAAAVEQARPRPGPIARAREVPARAMRAGFVWASQRRSLEALTERLPLTRGLVTRFVAGEDLDAVLRALRRLQAGGLRSTVDILGESVASADAATAAADRYVELLDALADAGLDRNVSLKLTQMGLDIEEGVCRRNVARVVERAAALDAFVRIDMEDHTRTDATLGLARDLFAQHGNVGVVVQSYLRRSERDVENLIGEGIRVRLCKGAYNEPPSVAFASKREVDESYARLMERLLDAGTYPALATHDERLIERAARYVAENGIGRDRYEFQMLYGVRRDLQETLAAEGHTVRVYVPFGAQWYPYFMRRLAERPANVVFVLRNLLRDRGR